MCGLSVLWVSFSWAQSYTDITHLSAIEGVWSGSNAFADVDGDGDPDVLITGTNASSDPIARLYTNDGTGVFTEVFNTPFVGVEFGAVAFADVDGDQDQDVLIAGSHGFNSHSTRLYINDGSGRFMEDTMGANFEVLARGALSFADVDGDRDKDVLVVGNDEPFSNVSLLYINDGMGNFTRDTSRVLVATTYNGSMSLADVDGDRDNDVLVTGIATGLAKVAHLYKNDGSGNFQVVPGTPFERVADGDFAFADVDGDQDLDVLITGEGDNYTPIARLYINNGQGTFTEAPHTPFPGVEFSSVAFADVDGDKDADVIIGGTTASHALIMKLYTNDGTGHFTEVQGNPFQGLEVGSVHFADLDGDRDMDLFTTGLNASFVPQTKLYRNTGSGISLKEVQANPEKNHPLKLYPNPTAKRRLYLDYYAQRAGSLTLNLYDTKGLLLKQIEREVSKGEQTLTIDVSFLSAGYYILQPAEGENGAATTPVILR